MSKKVFVTIGIATVGIPGWLTKDFRPRKTEITAFLEKRLGTQCKYSEIVHQHYHQIVFAIDERPDMADFLATLRADIRRMLNVDVTTDWSEHEGKEDVE
jgi:hypothetical protein